VGSSTREGIGLVAAGCLPFAVGALATRDGVAFMPPCPFRSVTGLPCPLCGGTRAFAWAARGDSGFLHYNAFWVLVAVVLVIAGAVVLVRGQGCLDGLTRTPRRAMITLLLLGGLGWAYALAERATIAPPA
jgi:Protein of unknown function (DUF2752)